MKKQFGNTESSLKNLLRFLAGFDSVQLGAMGALLGIGVLFIYSTGIQIGTAWAAGLYLKQLQWIAVGFCCYLILALVATAR